MSRIIVITGNGKGKTTSALGTALRAAGHGIKVSIIQFIKNRTDTGEIAALAHIPEIEIQQTGIGFVPSKDSILFQQHVMAAQKGLALAHTKLNDSSTGMIILDEICGAIHHGLLDNLLVINTIKSAHKNAIIICTGRNAPETLCTLADTVSVIEPLKHGLDAGIKAQAGVEY